MLQAKDALTDVEFAEKFEEQNYQVYYLGKVIDLSNDEVLT